MFKKICMFVFSGIICVCVSLCAYAEDEEFIMEETIEEVVPEKTADEISAEALGAYDVEGSLFEKITNLEQEKLIMKLEAERIKLDLELESLNAQRLKKQMEMEGATNRPNQQQEIQAAKAEVDAKIENLRKQIADIDSKQEAQYEEYDEITERREVPSQIAMRYKLINVVGVGNQLQATIQDLMTGQNRRISVGKELNGYIVKSISLNDGIVFEKNGVSENLNVGR